jgi:hypothetical protein
LHRLAKHIFQVLSLLAKPMPVLTLLLDPDYSEIYGFAAVIPSLCICFFLGVMIVLCVVTKHWVCLVVALLFYLINLFLLTFVQATGLDSFVPWVLGISTALIGLNVLLFFWSKKRKKLTQQENVS